MAKLALKITREKWILNWITKGLEGEQRALIVLVFSSDRQHVYPQNQKAAYFPEHLRILTQFWKPWDS